MARDQRPSINNDAMSPSQASGKARSCGDGRRGDLYHRARDLRVEGRPDMTKDGLNEALHAA